jgi:hypothetical protein
MTSYVIHVWDNNENLVNQHQVSADSDATARAELDQVARQYARDHELELAYPMGGAVIARTPGLA